MPTFEEALQTLAPYIEQPRYEKLTPKKKQAEVGKLAEETELGQWPGDEKSLDALSKAKTYPELNTLSRERRDVFGQVERARKQTSEINAADAAQEQTRQRSSPDFRDRAKTLGHDILDRFFPETKPPSDSPVPTGVPTTSPPRQQPVQTPDSLGPPGPLPAAPPTSRFQVDEGEIVDTKAGQIISLDQFEKVSTPQEKAEVMGLMSAHHKYDFGAAKEAGISQDPVTGHWDSRFKHDDNPRRFLPSESGIYDTKYNKLIPQAEFERIATQEQKDEFSQNKPLPAAEVQGYLRSAQTNPELQAKPAAPIAQPGMPPGPPTQQIDPRTGQPIPVLKNEPAPLMGVERVPQIIREQGNKGITDALEGFASTLRHYQAHPEEVSPLNAIAMKVREYTGYTHKLDLVSPVADLMSSIANALRSSKAPLTPQSIPEKVTAGVVNMVTEQAPTVLLLRRMLGNMALGYATYGLIKGSMFEDEQGKPVFDGLNRQGAIDGIINLATIGILHGLAPTNRMIRAGAGFTVGAGTTAAQGGSTEDVVSNALMFGVAAGLPPGNPQFMRLWGEQWNKPKPPPGPPKDVTPKPPPAGVTGPTAEPPGPPTPAPTPKPTGVSVGVTAGVSAEPPPEATTAPVSPPPSVQPPAPIVVPGANAAAVEPPQPVAQIPQPQPMVGPPGPTQPVAEPKKAPAAPTVDDIHALADAKKIPWDDDPAFLQMTKAVTGREHLDQLTPEERSKMIDHLAALPSSSSKAARFENEPDRIRRHAQDLSDTIKTQTFQSQGFSGLEIPRQRAVLASMFTLAHDPEIRKAVVSALPINVVNDLRMQQLSPEELFHNKTMFKDYLVGKLESPIPSVVNGADTIMRIFARQATKVLSRRNTKKAGNSLSTVRTGEIAPGGSLETTEASSTATNTSALTRIAKKFEPAVSAIKPDPSSSIVRMPASQTTKSASVAGITQKPNVTIDADKGKQDVAPPSDVKRGTEAASTASVPPTIPIVTTETKPEHQKNRVTANDYLNEPINFGGKTVSRGEAIKQLQAEGADQKKIDAYMMWAKNIEGERGSFPPLPYSAGIPILGIKPKEPEPVIGANSEDGYFHSQDPNVEARYQQAAKGIGKETLIAKLKEFWDTFKRRSTRKYEYLPDTAEFSPLQFALDNLEKQKGISNELQMRALHEIVGKLSDPKMDLFTRKVILMDLTKEAEAGRLLPYGYTHESVARDLADVDQLLTLNPDVQTSFDQRQALWTDRKRRYSQAMDAIGFDVSKKITKDDYFRHQVLAYAQEMAGPPTKGTGERVRTPTGRSFLKQRVGSTYDINANYLQAEFEVLAQMDYDIHLAQVIKLVDDRYNIQPRLKEQARQANETAFRAELQQQEQGSALEEDWKHIRQMLAFHMKKLKQALHLEEEETVPMAEINRLAADSEAEGHASALGVFKWINRRRALIKATLGDKFKTWEDVVPTTHAIFQPREGNIFYMADTLPHQMVQQLMERMGTQMGISAADLKKVLAMGGKREQFVIPEPVAQTLTEMKKPEYSIAQRAWAEIQGSWKAGKLVGPHSVFKYNLRNLSGDAEAAFVGNPSSFKYAPRAVKDLLPVFMGRKTLQGPVKDWFERGGMGTLLQINEMGDMNDLTIFQHLQERSEKRGLLSIPAKVFSKYWKTARLATDFREAILRYANYLDYLKQIEERGTPKNYGASIRATVDALEDPKDKAFKLSNELIGAYDRISVNGAHLRRYWMPFWSWKEVNFSRYKQLIKNAFHDRDYSSGARAAAFKSASTLLKLAFAYGMLQVWNQLVFPEEEKDLNERTRNRVHIILPPGRTADGKITYLDGIGAIGDLLSWVGLDGAFSHLVSGDLLHDRMTLKELSIEMLKAPFNVLTQALGPLPAKLPAELFAQRSSFPDVFNPQAIRDPAQHVAQQLTPFGPEYNAATGKPGKPYLGLDSMRNLVTSTQDPGSAAYHNWQAIEDKWRGRMGKPSFASYQRSPKGQALADWSQSLRMGDQSGIEKYKQQYVAAGGDLKSMVASVRALAPLNGLTKDEKAYVLGQLDAREKAVLKKAEQYYLDEMMKILPPLQRSELMGSLMEHGGLSPAIIPRKTLPPKIPDVLNRVP